MNDATVTKGNWPTRLLYTGLVLLVGGLIVGQLGINPFASMLSIAIAFLVLIAAAVIVLIALLRGRSATVSNQGWLALLLGLGAVGITGNQFGGGGGGAPIHDISTDTTNPPEFIVVATLRSEGDNPAEYLDDGTAEQQAEAYPDIDTLTLNVDSTAAFGAALTVAESMGWEIVAAEPSEGRIEATASTPFVGFKDDVVIRVQPDAAGSIVDVRSKSRIGKGDMGVNATRVREYSAKLLAETS